MAEGSTASDMPIVGDVPTGEIPWPTDPEICPRLNRQNGKHAFVWKAFPGDTVYCINCGQERKRTRSEDTVIAPSIPQDQPVPVLEDSEIFVAPEVPAEETTPDELKAQVAATMAENEQKGNEVADDSTPQPEMTPVGSIPAYTGGGAGTAAEVGMPASPPPAPVEDVQVASPAPAPGE